MNEDRFKLGTGLPDRIGIDANGFGWRVWNDSDFWSMVPQNPDNEPVPEPITWYERVRKMHYYEAPHVYVPEPGQISVFLAGGITDCPDWQADMIELLSDTDLVVLNPRQKNFNVRDPNASDAQIKWEFDHLRLADRIMFWFPHSPPSVCPITLFELGYWLGQDKPLAIGIEPGYVREVDVRTQTGLIRPEVPIVSTLEDLAVVIQ